MDAEKLKKLYKNADRVVRFLDVEGKFRVSMVNNTQTAITAKENHNLHYAPAVFLAKLLASTSIISSFLKGEERVQIDIDGNGLINKLFAESLQVGESRGFARYDEINIENENIDFNSFLGIGLLKVTKILYDKREPISGIVNLQNSDIAYNLSYYFSQSEQVPSIFILDVKIDDEGNILKSGGFVVQALPGATITEIQKVQEVVSKVQNFAEMLELYSFEEIAKIIFPFEFNLISSTRVDFFCRCSKENFLSKLVTLNLNEIKDMKAKGENELVCIFCNKHYYIEDQEFDDLITHLQAMYN